MGALVNDLADAIVTNLNSAPALSQSFTAVRSFDLEKDLTALSGLIVLVTPKAASSANAARDATEWRLQVDVGIKQKLTDLTNAVIDPLLYLAQEIAERFARVRCTTPDAVCVGQALEPIYDPALLRETRTFLSVVTLTFQAWR